jgi:hypothetical protein
MTDQQERAIKTVVMVVDLALAAALLWMILPSSVTDPVAVAAKAELAKVGSGKRRRTVERQMQFDIIMALEALDSYDQHRDPEQLARDLAPTG